MRKRLKFTHSINDYLFNKFRFPGSRKIGRFTSKILLPALNQQTTVPTIYDFDMVVNENGGKEIYYLGFYEVGTLDVIKKCLEPTDNFIDIGASIGLMSVFASKCIPQGIVLSFEPQKERFEILKKNAAINDCKNIQMFNNGLGKKEDQLKLYTDVFSPSIVDTENSAGKHELVDILILDKVVESKEIETIKFIKIDVEGFELDVLTGAKKLLSNSNPPIICVEYVKRLQSMNKNDISIVDFIKQVNNYRLFQLEKTSNTVSKLVEVEDERDLRDCDNIYCFTEKHIDNLKSANLFK